MIEEHRIRIILAEDHAIVREGVKSLLGAEDDFTVIADTGDGLSVVKAAHALSPDIVLMDIGLPGLSGIDATRQLAAELPEVKVICLSMHRERQIVGAALRAGAKGYLVKDCASDELIEAIHTVAGGGTYLSPDLAGEAVHEMMHGERGNGNDPDGAESATPDVDPKTAPRSESDGQ
jgi:DNA-binding NarL/FixJ family response regulator